MTMLVAKVIVDKVIVQRMYDDNKKRLKSRAIQTAFEQVGIIKQISITKSHR